MITLRRIDPDKNMARFYTLAIHPDMFGNYTLMRQWGRIGAAGQRQLTTYDALCDAIAAHKTILTAKRRRGYTIAP